MSRRDRRGPPRRGAAPRGVHRGKAPRPGRGDGRRQPVPFTPSPVETRPLSPEEGRRWVYGMNPVLEALRAHPEQIERLYLAHGQVASGTASELFSRARDAGVRVVNVPREKLAIMTQGGVHQGIVAELRTYDYAELPDLLAAAKASGRPPLLVVLDGIEDPHNLGAIIRSAYALGAHGVVIAKDRAAKVTGLVAKASAGAVEHCPVARVINISRALEEMKAAGLWIAAAIADGDQPLSDAKLDGPLALVVGGEGGGVRLGVLEHCDFRLKIPMLGKLGSLNASVAAGILLYEVLRQRSAH